LKKRGTEMEVPRPNSDIYLDLGDSKEWKMRSDGSPWRDNLSRRSCYDYY